MTDKARTPNPLTRLTLRWMPFADAASEGLPLGQLLRLSLFQLSVGMATVMLLGTLNRVMIVELAVPAIVVAAMIALPVLSAPFRALLGFRSDTHRSAIGWKRVPYLWFGSLWQMGGLAVMPFALLVLGGDVVHQIPYAGPTLAGIAFLMAGLGRPGGRCDAAAGGGASVRHVPDRHGDFRAGDRRAFGGLLRS